MESTPFLGEIGLCAFDFPPRGWATCAGELLPINQNQALFSLLGTAYGGDGVTTFALPDLRGRVPVHADRFAGQAPGEAGGAEQVTLLASHLPAHTHQVRAARTADRAEAEGNVLAPATSGTPYRPAGGTFGFQTLTPTGAQRPHENRQPSLALHYCIALTGIFPTQP